MKTAESTSIRLTSLGSLAIFVLSLLALSASAQPGPLITLQPTSQTVLAGGTATLSVTASGTGQFSYIWQFNGTNLQYPILTTVAGGGTNSPGDGGAATNASLRSLAGVAVDISGNLFIADLLNNRIRKVDANGIITTVAGNGTNAYSGDGGAAINASLHGPASVAVDRFGNLFIADIHSNRVRKVDLNGIITTMAGGGTTEYTGGAGAATTASLSDPSDVVVDASGNLFISGLSASSAGAYQVVITSRYGSVTSAVATLTVLAPPGIVMDMPVVAGGDLVLGFSVSNISNAPLTLLQAASINGPWTTNTGAVVTTNAQTGGRQFVIPAPGSVQFYQLRSP